MTARTTSALVLIATLLIGIVLGALLFGAVQRQRFQHALRLVRPDRFAASVEQVVQPKDEAQRQAIRQVLEKADARMRADRQAMSQRMRAGLDSLQTGLSAVLDESQMERLREHLTRHRGALRRGPGARPPGARPPGAKPPGAKPPAPR